MVDNGFVNQLSFRQAGHQDPFLVLSISRQERIDALNYLKSLPGSADLLSKELGLAPGEPEEPYGNP